MLYRYNHVALPPDGIKLNETYEIIIDGEIAKVKGNGCEIELPTYKVKILFTPIEEKKTNKQIIK